MSEILVKTLTRHRDSADKFYLKDWTAGDICQIMPDGFFTKNKYFGAKHMGIVLCVNAKIPQDYAGGVTLNPNITYENKSFTSPILSRSNLIIDLASILTDEQLKDAFNHQLLVNPITLTQSYLDLFIDRSERTSLLTYDKSGSFDDEIVDVGPNGHPDANTFLEFESNLDATLTGPVIGDCNEDCDETGAITFNGTNADATNYVEFKASGDGRHEGIWSLGRQSILVSNASALTCWDNGCRLTNLQIGKSSSSANTQAIVALGANAAGAEVKIQGCILRQAGNSSYPEPGISTGDVDTKLEAWNNLIYGLGSRVASDNACIRLIGQASGTKIYANTLIGGYKGVYSNANQGNVTVYSNCAYGQAQNSYDHSNTAWADADMNGWYVDEDQGTNGIDLSGEADTDLFTAPGSDDYSVKGTDSALHQAGKDLDGDTPAITDDIIGTARHATTPCLGAFEIVVVSGETFYQNAGQGAVAIVGALVKKTSKYPGGHVMTIVGVLSKKISKYPGGHAMSIAGILNKKTTPVTAMGGHSMTITGILTKAVVFTQDTGGHAMTITGALTTVATFFRTVGSYAIAIVGTLLKKTSKSVGGGQTASTGTLNKKTTPATAMGGHAMSIDGTLTKAVVLTQNTGGHAMTITGVLTTVGTFVRAVGGYAVAIVGTLVKKTSKGVGDGQVSPTGILSKKTSKEVGGGSVTSIGTLATATMYMQAVGGASMSIIGSLATQFIAGTGIVAKFIRRRKTFYKQ